MESFDFILQPFYNLINKNGSTIEVFLESAVLSYYKIWLHSHFYMYLLVDQSLLYFSHYSWVGHSFTCC